MNALYVNVKHRLRIDDHGRSVKNFTRQLFFVAMFDLAEFLTKSRVGCAFFNVPYTLQIGNPFFSTDTAASLRAMEIKADVLLKGTKVEGVYNADPVLVKDAVKYDEITYMEILRQGLKVMDLTAVSLCKDNNLPMIIFNMNQPGNIRRVVQGEKVGSLVTA